MATTPAPKIDLRSTITCGYAATHPPVACTFCGVVSQCDKNTFNINCRVGNAKVREYTIATYHLHWPRKKGDPCTAAYVRVIQAHPSHRLSPTRLRLEKSEFRALVLKAKLKQDTSQHDDKTSPQDTPEYTNSTSSSCVYILWGSQSMRQEQFQHRVSCWQGKGGSVHHCNLLSSLATKEGRPLHRRLREGYPGAGTQVRVSWAT